MNLGLNTLWSMILCFISMTVVAGEKPLFPLEPADTSSPRATLENFMHNTALGVQAYYRGEHSGKILPWFQRAERCLDLSEVSPDRAASISKEAGLLIYEILNRAGLPDSDKIPDKAVVQRDDIKTWKIPHTDITIAKVEEGEERAGEFLFCPQSIKRSLEYYEKVKHLPHETSYTPGNYEQYVTHPAFIVPYLWADELPQWIKIRLLRNPLWKWLVILITSALAVVVTVMLYKFARKWNRYFAQNGGQWRIGTLLFALSLVVIPLIFEYFLKEIVGIRFDVQAVISKVLLGLSFLAAVYAVFAVFESMAIKVVSNKRFQQSSRDGQLVMVSTRMLAIFVSIYLIIEASEYLGMHLAPVIAGLGIGGLAVALAARPTLENIIGGFTMFADKPVRVGDYCYFGDQEGTVEDIGLRSTRIRKRDDTLVIIPNADFSQMQLQNYTCRRHRLYRPTIGLRYETTAEQIRYVIVKLREMLVAHPKVLAEPLFVRFIGFGAYSLEVEIFAQIDTQDWLKYGAIREDINLRIIDIVKEAGTGFAFPSQTTYFARDGGLDTEHSQQVESQVENWRSKGKLPFPEFEQEEQDRLENSIDYPPKGSPDYIPRG